jgi:membrane carboxypeptidase/penicillin-binding protein
LGGGEVKPIDMAEAYGVFANSGIKPLTAITKVADWKGNV